MTPYVRPLPRHAPGEGSPAFAALLTTLLPGLGQMYQGRWVRGVLFVVLPILTLTLAGAFLLTADPLTTFALRNAALVALILVGGLYAFHVTAVADAFAGRLTRVRGRQAVDYAVLAALVLGLSVLYVSVYRQSAAWATVVSSVFEPVTRTVGSLPPSEPEPTLPPAWSGRERLNVLLLGIDTREGGELTQNTDTVMVVSVDPVNDTAVMLSIPRDTLVEIPGVGSDKVNAAYAYGGEEDGPDYARRAVEDLLGITIHSYALVDFDAFRDTVDALGGVLLDVRRPLHDEAFPTEDFGLQRVRFAAGPQLLDGERALQYARSRHSANDFDRARRQQQVLAAVRERVAQAGLFRLPPIIERVGPAIRTNFDPGGILPLARTAIGIESGDIRSEVLLPCNIPVEHCELTEDNSPAGYFLMPDRDRIRLLVEELFYDPSARQEADRDSP